jgi:CMP-N-acetylneuraminic acid synthetase
MLYTIRAAQYSAFITKVFVSTDSLSYAKIAQQEGAYYTPRPPELAADDTRDYAVVEHFLNTVDHVPDYLAYLRPTTPLRKAPLIDMAIKDFIQLCEQSDKPPTALRSVEEMSESAFKCYTMLGQLLISIGNDPDAPNQELVKTYKPNGYIDIIRPKHMLASGELWGNRVYGFKTPPTIEIDTENDFKLAEYQMAVEEGGRFVFTH